MSIAPVLSLAHHRLFDAVDEQAPLLESAQRKRLVVCCEEPRKGGRAGWARRLSDAVFLQTRRASTDDSDLLEAIRYAQDTFGVEEVVLVVHTQCAHRKCEQRPRRVVSGASDIFWLQDRIADHRSELDQAKDEVRESVARLRAGLDGDTSLVAAVEFGETGQLLGFVEEEDDFRAIV